ncbi:MAG TPA: TlpA disulfide reductase family protein [Sporichthya sp.]|jgi:thiol-disulfide isomerase/thioredoxin|nr:TlpA disulfide reductase family protein [Sporichthya sp.]
MGRTMRGVRKAALTAAALGTSLLAAGCGNDGSGQASTAALPSAAAIIDSASVGAPAGVPAGRANTALPDLQVVRVASGQTVPLQTLAVSGKPTLLWFWAPHCTFCRAEAPDLLAFAKAHGAQVQILGLGAQDDLGQAVGFLSDTATEKLEMVWDASGKSWLHYKVTNQPTVVVLDARGNVTRTWFRHFDAKAILAAAGLKA